MRPPERGSQRPRPGANVAGEPGETPPPFALAARTGKGVRLFALDAAARAAGLVPDMALADALALVPRLQTAPAAPQADAEELRRRAHWCGRYGPASNCHGADGIWIDVTGAAHLFDGEAALLVRIESDFARLGFTARTALASTIGAAAALARFAAASPAARIAPAGETARHLAPLPIEALDLAPETAALLRRLGLTQIGRLLDLPRAALERRFPANGEAVRQCLDHMLGLRGEPPVALQAPPAFLSRLHFSAPLLSMQAVEHALEPLAAELVRQLAAQRMGARRLTLGLWRLDGTAARVAIGTHAPCRDARHFITLLREKLARIEPGYGIDVITLAAGRAEPLLPAQATLAAAAPATDASVAHLVDRLANRLGGQQIAYLHPADSHLPERAQQRAAVPPPCGAWPPPAAVAAGASDSLARPFLLLEPAEEVTVMAPLPDAPPLLFTWRRVTRRVIAADGPERIAPEWWRELGTAASRTRDYYRVETEADGSFWLFRDGFYADARGATGPPRWYLHGFFG